MGVVTELSLFSHQSITNRVTNKSRTAVGLPAEHSIVIADWVMDCPPCNLRVQLHRTKSRRPSERRPSGLDLMPAPRSASSWRAAIAGRPSATTCGDRGMKRSEELGSECAGGVELWARFECSTIQVHEWVSEWVRACVRACVRASVHAWSAAR